MENYSAQTKGKKEITILIAAHKAYKMPIDEMYLPLHVGAEGKKDADGNDLDLGYTKDNTGDNISELNPSFCELTGLYWAWKNLESDYIGLAHYRRHFGYKKTKDLFESVLTYEQIKPYLGKIKIFTPNKRKYYIESLYDHYKHTHYIEQLDETRAIISNLYPEYVPCFDKVVKRTYGYMFNMMIMRKDFLDQYCQWLFDILFELKNRMEGNEKMQNLSVFQSRFYGRISEIIFNVWLERQLETGAVQKDEMKEIPVIHMDNINWWKKGTAFLKAKFVGKKYEGSF